MVPRRPSPRTARLPGCGPGWAKFSEVSGRPGDGAAGPPRARSRAPPVASAPRVVSATHAPCASAQGVGLTKTIALELAKRGITVNAVAPGAIETPLNTQAWDDQVRETYRRRIGPGRIGTVEEVADVVVFLGPYACRYITGPEIIVDGGLTTNWNVDHVDTGPV
jgi:NAD(P)-dependent dehydrogenase (short-subunit alcohol dehydrogenase family)